MKASLHRIRNAASFGRSLTRGLKRGDFFPQDGRRPAGPAPSGSHEEPHRAGPIRRAKDEVRWFTRTQHRVTVPGLQRPLQILHLTDVHLRRPCAWLDELCESLSNETPDLVAITGDVVTKGWTKEAVDQFLSAVPEAPLGRYAVMGNWEHWAGADAETWNQICLEWGVQLLQNQWIQLEDLCIAGTDDWLAGNPDIHAALEGIPADSPLLTLTHSPGFFSELAKHRAQLVLSGHSHGGQVRLPLLGALWVPKGTSNRVAGWYKEGQSHLFVSRGIGWSIAPMRLWCPPELAVIEMAPASI